MDHRQDYVWIYPSLGVNYYSQDQTYTGIASLLAWQWTIGDTQFPRGSKIGFELYWENLGKKPEEPFFFRVIDAQDRVWAEGTSQLVPGENNNPPVEQWREGEILREQGIISFPPDMPPGEYELLLNLPDPKLVHLPEYAIRFGNESVWENDTGLNKLLHNIVWELGQGPC